jgi:hypothetical protein
MGSFNLRGEKSIGKTIKNIIVEKRWKKMVDELKKNLKSGI